MKILVTAALVAAGATSAAAAMAVTITFVPEIAGKPFTCTNTDPGLGAPGADVQILDFRLYVFEAALIAADGSLHPIALKQDGAWRTGPVALVDFENGAGSCANGAPRPTPPCAARRRTATSSASPSRSACPSISTTAIRP